MLPIYLIIGRTKKLIYQYPKVMSLEGEKNTWNVYSSNTSVNK